MIVYFFDPEKPWKGPSKMEIYHAGRQTGKTYYLVKKMRQDPENSVLIVDNARDADRLRREFSYPYVDTPLTEQNFEFIRRDDFYRSWGNRQKVYVDNLDRIIHQLLGPVSEATVSRAIASKPLTR